MHFQNDMDICEQIELTATVLPITHRCVNNIKDSEYPCLYILNETGGAGKYFCTSVSASRQHPRLEKRCADRMLIRLEVESPSTKRIMPDFAKTQSSSKCESFTVAAIALFYPLFLL